jgi:lipopolysaccharide transport system permease protein
MTERVESGAHADIPFIHIEPQRGWISLRLSELWECRELLYFLVWREVKIRYKQTIMGAAWVILQPIITMAIFTVIFGYIARFPSDGVPYPIFFYTALVPWTFFVSALGRGANSLVGDAQLIEKIYFPRLILPLSAVTSPLIDFAFGFLVLVILLLWYGISPAWGMLAVPLLILFAMLTALSVSLWLAPLNVRYRDVIQMVPFLIQIWMYASPIIYPVTMIPEKWRLMYSLNPMVGVVEGFRWAMLGTKSPAFDIIAASAMVVLLLLWGGVIFFRRTEQSFADVI